jgi:hypothetical protein
MSLRAKRSNPLHSGGIVQQTHEDADFGGCVKPATEKENRKASVKVSRGGNSDLVLLCHYESDRFAG